MKEEVMRKGTPRRCCRSCGNISPVGVVRGQYHTCEAKDDEEVAGEVCGYWISKRHAKRYNNCVIQGASPPRKRRGLKDRKGVSDGKENFHTQT